MTDPCMHLVEGLPTLREIASYIGTVDKETASSLLARADAERHVLIQPRSGVGTQDGMIGLLEVIDRVGNADLLTLTIDSYTRLGRFDTAHRLLAERPEELNGYPLVAHGYRAVRAINEAFSKPLQVRHGSPDGRHLFAVSLAGGIQSFEGGGISYNLPYCKGTLLTDSLNAWQEIDRTCGTMEKFGISIDREFFGTLSAVLMPPSISIAIVLLEAVLASRQGCRCLSLAYPQSGCVVQDVAALRAIRSLADDYLPQEASCYPVLHQFMGVFPQNPQKADALILLGGLTARLGRATKTINKTVQEAVGIPDADVNAAGVCMTRLAFEDHFASFGLDESKVAEETYWIKRETRELLDPILGEAKLIPAIVAAFRAGRLDIPFPSNPEAQGKVMPVRDRELAVRYARVGRLPFSSAVIRRHASLSNAVIDPGRPLYKAVLDGIMHFAS